MLIRNLEKKVVEINDIMQDGREAGMRFFADYDSKNPDIAPLFYQIGYLTIKEYYPEMESYLVGFPNCDMSEGLCQAVSDLRKGNTQSGARVFIEQEIFGRLEGSNSIAEWQTDCCNIIAIINFNNPILIVI